MPINTNPQIIFFSNYRIPKNLQDAHLKYYVKCKTILVENLTQFLSVSLDFLNKIMPPINLNSVNYSQERLVNDFHNCTYTSDDTPDLFNTLDFKDLKLLACLYEDISLESLISLCIDDWSSGIRYTYYNRSFISDNSCRKIVILFHQLLLRLHNYFPIYLAFENKPFVNKLVTDIFGKHLSCIPDMNHIVGLSAQEIYQISQTLSSVLYIAQLLQQHTSTIVSLPQDEQKIIIDKITSVPINDKVKLLDQILKDWCSNPQRYSSLLSTGELVNTVNQHDTKILDQSTFNQQQDAVDDRNEGVTTIGAIDSNDANYIQ